MCKMRRFPKDSSLDVLWTKKADDNPRPRKTSPNRIRTTCEIYDIHFSVAILRNLIRRQCIQYWREFCSTSAAPACPIPKKRVVTEKDVEARNKDTKIHKGRSNTFHSLTD